MFCGLPSSSWWLGQTEPSPQQYRAGADSFDKVICDCYTDSNGEFKLGKPLAAAQVLQQVAKRSKRKGREGIQGHFSRMLL
jgi:hypothetical protein